MESKVEEVQNELVKQGQTLESQLAALTITDQATYEAVGALVKTAKLFQSKVHESQDKICDAANRAHKVATQERARLLKPYEDVERKGKFLQATYYAEEELKNAEAAQAEQQRLEAEAKATREAERKRLWDAGKRKAAMAVAAAPLAIAPVPVKEAPKAQGQTVITIWRARVVEPDKVPFKFRVISQELLDAEAKALGGEARIPGCDVYEEKIIRQR